MAQPVSVAAPETAPSGTSIPIWGAQAWALTVNDGRAGGYFHRGQSLNTLLGKLLRIDVDSGSPYAIPADNPFVTLVRCLRPLIVFHIELLPKIDKLLSDIPDEFPRCDSRFGRRLLNFLSVLIDTCQIENVVTFEPMIARDHIGQHFFVSMTNVRGRVSVIDRRGDEEGLPHTVKLAD